MIDYNLLALFTMISCNKLYWYISVVVSQRLFGCKNDLKIYAHDLLSR